MDLYFELLKIYVNLYFSHFHPFQLYFHANLATLYIFIKHQLQYGILIQILLSNFIRFVAKVFLVVIWLFVAKKTFHVSRQPHLFALVHSFFIPRLPYLPLVCPSYASIYLNLPQSFHTQHMSPSYLPMFARVVYRLQIRI